MRHVADHPGLTSSQVPGPGSIEFFVELLLLHRLAELLVLLDRHHHPGCCGLIPCFPIVRRWPEPRRGGLLGVGADPVFAAGAGYPLAGLLLALPAVEATWLVEARPADSPTHCQARTGCSRRSQPAHGRPTADAQQH
jgi:hypothetical protein